MRKSICAVVFMSALVAACGQQKSESKPTQEKAVTDAPAPSGMLLDYASDQVIKKFENSTCEQLKAQKGEPQSEKAKMAVDFLKNDAQARVGFINKIAAPVLNKMFECGMIP